MLFITNYVDMIVMETWEKITEEIRMCASKEPVLSDFFEQSVLNHASLAESLAFILLNY